VERLPPNQDLLTVSFIDFTLLMQVGREITGSHHFKSQIQTMVDKSNPVEIHLKSIIESLEDIEGRSREGQKATEKIITQKKEIASGRLRDRAEQLIEACNEYLTSTDKKGSDKKAIETELN
jgi:hypothetical protein